MSQDHRVFENVAIGVVGLRSDDDAVAAAQMVAPAAAFDLVHVYPAAGQGRPDLGEHGRFVRDEAMRLVERVRREAELESASVHVVPGHSASRILKRYVDDTRPDLLVLGATHHAGAGGLVLGDTARGVLHGATCPVLAVARAHPATPEPPARIGVAYDGSPEAEQALGLAVQIAATCGARLDVVEAVSLGVVPEGWGFHVADVLEGAVRPEQLRLTELAAQLGVVATGSAVMGATSAVLLALAERVDLIVCGSRSWGAPGRVALGSTADRLLHESPVPVVLVPRGVVVRQGDAPTSPTASVHATSGAPAAHPSAGRATAP